MTAVGILEKWVVKTRAQVMVRSDNESVFESVEILQNQHDAPARPEHDANDLHSRVNITLHTHHSRGIKASDNYAKH